MGQQGTSRWLLKVPSGSGTEPGENKVGRRAERAQRAKRVILEPFTVETHSATAVFEVATGPFTLPVFPIIQVFSASHPSWRGHCSKRPGLGQPI